MELSGFRVDYLLKRLGETSRPVAVTHRKRQQFYTVLGVLFYHTGILPHRRVERNCKTCCQVFGHSSAYPFLAM